MHGMFEWYWRSKEEKRLICVKTKFYATLTCVQIEIKGYQIIGRVEVGI